MAFVPPLFSKFGKACSDLLTQKWECSKGDFKHQASIKSQSQGVTITSTAYAEDAGLNKVSGKVNVKYVDKSFGEATGEFVTAGTFKGTAKLTKLQKGVVVNSEVECNNACTPTGKGSVEYTQDSFAVSGEFNHKKSNFVASAAFGLEGFSVGGAATVDTKKALAADGDKKDVVNVEAGIQYENGNLVGAFQVDKSYAVTASIYHRVSSALQVGSKAFVDSTKSENNSVTLGAQYKVDSATTVKGKAEIKGSQNYVVSTFLEHRVPNPNVVVGLTSKWNCSDKAASKFGVNFSFGDY